MKDKDFIALVLAAGKGTRMKSNLPKVLHKLLGQPILAHVLDMLEEAGARDIYIIVGHGAKKVMKVFQDSPVHFVTQTEQLGTGHAVMIAKDALSDIEGNLLIICGDTPLFRPETLRRFVDMHNQCKNSLSILSASMEDPTGYGRIIRDNTGQFIKIVEEKDASRHEKGITEINTGTYLVDRNLLFALVRKIGCNNAQNEFYLTDLVELAVQTGHRVGAFCLASGEEALGINSRGQLAAAEAVLLSRIRDQWMAKGVSLSMPETVYIEKLVKIGQDTVVGPFSMLKGITTIGEGVEIGAYSILEDARIPPGTVIKPFSLKKGS